MTNITEVSPWEDTKHEFWAYVSRASDRYIEFLTERKDISARVLPDTRGTAVIEKEPRTPAFFHPASSTLFVDATIALKNVPQIDANMNLIRMEDRITYPILSGLLFHEMSHAMHTLYGHNTKDAQGNPITPLEDSFVTSMEEFRCEYKFARKHPDKAEFVFSAVAHINFPSSLMNIRELAENPEYSEMNRIATALNMYFLIVARVKSGTVKGHLIPNEITDYMEAFINGSKKSFLERKVEETFDLEDTDFFGLLDIAREIIEEFGLSKVSPNEKPKDLSACEHPTYTPVEKKQESEDSSETPDDTQMTKPTPNMDASSNDEEESEQETGEGADGEATDGGAGENGSLTDSNSDDGKSADGDSPDGGESTDSEADGDSGSSTDSDGESDGQSTDSETDADDSSSNGSGNDSADSSSGDAKSESGESDSDQNGDDSSEFTDGNADSGDGASDEGDASESDGDGDGEGSDEESSDDLDGESEWPSQETEDDPVTPDIERLIKDLELAIDEERKDVIDLDATSKLGERIEQSELKMQKEMHDRINAASHGKTISDTGMLKDHSIPSGIESYSGKRTFDAKMGNRVPTQSEREQAKALEDSIRKAQFRSDSKYLIDSELPPGRFRTRQAMRLDVQRSMKLDETATPWKRTKREVHENPELNVAMAIDFSGSMEKFLHGVSGYGWILSQAVKRNRGNVSSVFWDVDVYRGILPNEFNEVLVQPVAANGGSTGLNMAIEGVSGIANLLGNDTGVNVLVILTDSDLPNYPKINRELTKLVDLGVMVLWLSTTPLTKHEQGRVMKHSNITKAYVHDADKFAEVVTDTIHESLLTYQPAW